MKDITGPKMALEIAKAGGLGILHRFCTIEDNIKTFKEVSTQIKITDPLNIGVSIGVKNDDKHRFEELYENGARIFCIDVAHGHSAHVKNILHWINSMLFKWTRGERGRITIIAGNVATREGYIDLANWGADAVKVGIGPGSVCTTRKNTGVGVPQLKALEDVYLASCDLASPPSIIADGGIKHVGDIAKALKYADAVMIGSLFAGTTETPGEVYRNYDNEYYKVYGGSASGENRGENRFVEGVIKTVKFKGKVKYVLREIKQGLQSAFSYVGANNLNEFQHKCSLIPISSSSQDESRL